MGQYYTPAQINVITSTRIANEGDMYLDTTNKDYYIGLTHGILAKIGDTIDEKIDTIYQLGDSLVIVEGNTLFYLDINDNDWKINANGTGLEAAAAGNNIASGAYSIAAGRTNSATGANSTVSGGLTNSATNAQSTVGGGNGNTASGIQSVVGGGGGNAGAGPYSTIRGGRSNTAPNDNATVGGGRNNAATGTDATTIGGGTFNTASVSRTTISGGSTNTASAFEATIAGGGNNTASGSSSVISGGSTHTASGSYTTVSGGFTNQSVGNGSLISGGQNNIATGRYSAVSGGESNRAYSYGEWVGGYFSTVYTANSTTAHDGRDKLFVVGNGVSGTPSNAITLMKDGRLGLGVDGNLAQTATLHINPKTVIDPLRVEKLNAATTSDTAFLVTNPANGTVKYLSFNKFRSPTSELFFAAEYAGASLDTINGTTGRHLGYMTSNNTKSPTFMNYYEWTTKTYQPPKIMM